VASESLADFLSRTRAQVDQALDRYLPRPPECPAILAEAMRYSVLAGGKRLRPVLTLAAADAVSQIGPGSRRADRRAIDLALPAACAIEMIHTYSLIHDDLPAMDNDTLRRGRPTLHVVYGEGVAILAGDALLAEAFVLLARHPEIDAQGIAERKLWALSVVADAAGAGGMVAGQTLDLQAAGQVPAHFITFDAESLRAMHLRKTGALIRAAAVVGAVLAGGSHAAIAAVSAYATEIGLAFQIVDDILDVEGAAAELGKTVGKDAASAKLTYPALYGVERSRAMAQECVARAREALETGGLTEGHLMPIAEWVVSRRN
jgi:geranylgeranyl diphosphate synthase type II